MFQSKKKRSTDSISYPSSDTWKFPYILRRLKTSTKYETKVFKSKHKTHARRKKRNSVISTTSTYDASSSGNLSGNYSGDITTPWYGGRATSSGQTTGSSGSGTSSGQTTGSSGSATYSGQTTGSSGSATYSGQTTGSSGSATYSGQTTDPGYSGSGHSYGHTTTDWSYSDYSWASGDGGSGSYSEFLTEMESQSKMVKDVWNTRVDTFKTEFQNNDM